MIEWFNNLINTILPLCVALIIMFIIDTISGVLNAKKNGNFRSNELRKCIPKFLLYFCFILMTAIIDFIFWYYFRQSDVVPEWMLNFSTHYPITVVCKLFIILTESISFVENCRNYGIPIPSFIDSILNKSKELLDEEGDENDE